LRREWIIVSPHRTQRPWQGQVESKSACTILSYDPQCYLCPGNVRANGVRTPHYATTFAFENDFPALRHNEESWELQLDANGLMQAETAVGECRVLCFSPRHDLTLATMSIADICKVVEMWVAESRELAGRPGIQYVQIFENRGAMMGASNPHPHGQVWATSSVPNEPLAEQHAQRDYYQAHDETLLNAYLRTELAEGERVILTNEAWAVLVPFWASWPFETIVLPRQPATSFNDLSETQRDALAEILQRLTSGYDRVFETPFPYSMGFHQAPCDGVAHPEWTIHAHFYPPLLRSAAVRKFMVGFELLGSPQRDITAESAAETLRKVLG
jgi:UDPglucose--hexose-1-phosphate uridylyltransferase